jgi:hypothetical protein
MIVTNSAVEKFIERYAPWMDNAAARRLLESQVRNARQIKKGLWQMTDPDIILVTRFDPQKNQEVCISVGPDPVDDTSRPSPPNVSPAAMSPDKDRRRAQAPMTYRMDLGRFNRK